MCVQWKCISGIASVELLQWKCFSGSASRINEVQQVQVNGGISLKMASMVLKWLVIIVKTQAVISPPNNNNNSDDDNNISISFVNNKTPSSNSQHQQEQQRLRITSQLQQVLISLSPSCFSLSKGLWLNHLELQQPLRIRRGLVCFRIVGFCRK